MQDIRLHQNIVKKRSRFKTFKKWLKRLVLLIMVCLIGAGIFVKLNPTGAADFTDNYLRPIIGDKIVIYIENIFFSVSDKVDSLVYKFKSPISPQFLDQSKNLVNQSTTEGEGWIWRRGGRRRESRARS